jgi:MYXO-CTERM domain-containing protein
MKTQKKNSRSLYLQKKNNRWKWMAGATAATAAGVNASHASTITISLLDNYISVFGFGDIHLNADLTGDGHPDLTIANADNRYGYRAQVTLNGVQAYCRWFDSGLVHTGFMRLGSKHATWYDGWYYNTTHGTRSLMGSIPIFFKDLHINGGAPTRGALQVTVSANYIVLDTLTYNTPVQFSSRTVPDNESSLALLAMGAGGVLALRRRRPVQNGVRS